MRIAKCGLRIADCTTREWSARQDLHLHRALIECDRGYKPRCAALHHAPKLPRIGFGVKRSTVGLRHNREVGQSV